MVSFMRRRRRRRFAANAFSIIRCASRVLMLSEVVGNMLVCCCGCAFGWTGARVIGGSRAFLVVKSKASASWSRMARGGHL